MRLVNGGTDYTSSGTVEVYLNNEWGTICDYEITVNEANTICRQLGYTSSVTYSSTSSPARYICTSVVRQIKFNVGCDA